jgi:hypothetical protein
MDERHSTDRWGGIIVRGAAVVNDVGDALTGHLVCGSFESHQTGLVKNPFDRWHLYRVLS